MTDNESQAGYHQFTDESGEKHGSFEVFWFDDPNGTPPGWFWWACFPGCIPDGDGVPSGPFDSSTEARKDADPEWRDD